MPRGGECPRPWTPGSPCITIVYGVPGDLELIERAKRGDVELGGCLLGFHDPSSVCRGPEPHYWLEDETGVREVAAPGRDGTGLRPGPARPPT